MRKTKGIGKELKSFLHFKRYLLEWKSQLQGVSLVEHDRTCIRQVAGSSPHLFLWGEVNVNPFSTFDWGAIPSP